MFHKSVAAAMLVASTAFLPGLAQAASGYTIGRAEMRAGPDYDYPIVQIIRDGRRVEIFGCLRDWSWCDVGYRDDRGWVDGEHLVADYRGRRQTIISIAPYLGIGILSFSFGNYWDSYYRSRPFYSERRHWESRSYERYRPSWGPRPSRPGPREEERHHDDRARPNEPYRQPMQQRDLRPAEQQQRQQMQQHQVSPPQQPQRQQMQERQVRPPEQQQRQQMPQRQVRPPEQPQRQQMQQRQVRPPEQQQRQQHEGRAPKEQQKQDKHQDDRNPGRGGGDR